MNARSSHSVQITHDVDDNSATNPLLFEAAVNIRWNPRIAVEISVYTRHYWSETVKKSNLVGLDDIYILR